MRKLLTVAVTVIALVPLAGTPAAASDHHLIGVDKLLTLKNAGSVYPGLKGGTRFLSRYGISAPRFAMVHGKLKCDRYQTFPGVRRRGTYFFNVDVERSVSLDQSAVRFKTVTRAKSLMRHYRTFIRKCKGTHDTTDGEGGYARMKVRGWPTPRIGNGSIGMLTAFIQYGETGWRRSVIARTGRTVSVQEATIYSGKGSPKQAIRISRKAIARLS